MKGKYVWKRTKTVGDVAGSGVKPFAQKGRGAARAGNKRAPQRKGGAKAHGVVPRNLEFPINNKLRLQAYKILLSAKLYEDKLVFIESEQLEYSKTKYLDEIVKPFGFDKLLFVSGHETCPNFEMAQSAISNVHLRTPSQFSLPDMLTFDRIFITKDGLAGIEEVLEARHKNAYRNKKIPHPDVDIDEIREARRDSFEVNIIKPIRDAEDVDDKTLELLTPTLKTYIDDLREYQSKNSQKESAE